MLSAEQHPVDQRRATRWKYTLAVTMSWSGGQVRAHTTDISLFKVSATRMALKALQRGKREVPVEERVLVAMPLSAEDPELHYLKEHYRDAFKDSVRQAIAGLDARQTNLICQHYLDGLTTHQLGALYGVNQSTAARWLERARQAILDRTRSGLMERLQVDRGEYDSIMRLLHSHLDVTLRSFLINLR